MLMEVLHNLVRMLALPVGMHHNDATLPDEMFQVVFNLKGSQCGVGVAGHDIPKNKLESKGAGYVDGVVIELPIGRAKQGRVVTVLRFEQTNRSEHLLFLLLGRMERHMRMDFPMGADFKEWNLEEGFHLPIVFRDPFSRHEEGGRDLLLNQIVDQCLVIARSGPHRAEVERQGNPRTRRWARLDYLSLRNGRDRRDTQHHDGQV